MQKNPRLEVASWVATIVATLIAIFSYISFGYGGGKKDQYTYNEIVACGGVALVLNQLASEGRLFDPADKRGKILNERMEEITDSVMVNSENAFNKMSLDKIKSYKKDVHM